MMTEFHSLINRSRATQLTLTVLLWLGTIVLGAVSLISFMSSVDQFILQWPAWGWTDSSVQVRGAIRLSHWIILAIGGIGWIAVTIGGGEYHLRKTKDPNGWAKSWRLFKWTYGIEFALLLPALFWAIWWLIF